MQRPIFDKIKSAQNEGRKQLAVLVDPDRSDEESLQTLAEQIQTSGADFIFLGGSLLMRDALDGCISTLKKNCDLPIVLFPGSMLQISAQADAMLLLSMISGRNPELLIGHHVIAAPYIKAAKLETLPTGYLLVDCGQPTTATYMSGSAPIPFHKPEIAACTAMAGEMLGLQLMYLDGGSGADKPVSAKMISTVRENVDTPIIVGGGIRSAAAAAEICQAGADVVVIGNATEKNPLIIKEIADAIHNV